MSSPPTLSIRQAKMFDLIKDYEQSGHSQTQFCSEKQLSKSTFYYWLTKYRKLSSSPSDEFIPIQITETDSCSSCRIILPNGVQIHLNGSKESNLILNILSKVIADDASGK